MLTEKDLYKFATPMVEDRGRTIQKAGGVLEFQQKPGVFEELIGIDAVVRGNNRHKYQVEMEIDEDEIEVYDAYCSCQEFLSESGLCKHCIAVLLEYIKRRDCPSEGTNRIRMMKPTDSEFLSLMNLYAKREKDAYLIGSLREQIHLEPYLKFNQYFESNVGFKIGNGFMYVLKDLDEFCEAVKNARTIKYGKQLEFVHHINAFDKESQPLVKFLQENVGNQSGYYGSYYYYSRHMKELPLDEDNLDALMNALEGRSFSCEVQGFHSKEWTIEEGIYPINAELVQEEEGYRLVFDKVVYQSGREYCYFFQTGGIICKSPKKNYQDIWELLEQINGKTAREYYIAHREMTLFARDMLPRLERHGRVKKKEIELDAYLPVPVEFEFYLDAPQRDRVVCRANAVYGKEKYELFAPSELAQQRDVHGEVRVRQEIGDYFNGYVPESSSVELADDEEKLYRLMTSGIARMQELGTVYLSDAIKSVQVRQVPRIAMGVSVSNGMLTMDLNSPEMPLEQLNEILSRYDRKKKYYRLKDGSFWQVDEEMERLAEIKTDLNISDSDWNSGSIKVPQFRAFYLDEALKENGLSGADRSREFRALIRNMKTVEENDFEVPVSLNPVLREYQKTGYQWLRTLQSNGFGGILADDMGLGKTLQVISLLLALREEGKLERVLVVTPASLVYNWMSELHRFAPSLKAAAAAGSQTERQMLLAQAEEWEVLITSYDLLRRDCELYQDLHFTVEIIDEAQFIKNANTQSAMAVKGVNAAFRLALTGTPVENRLSELWSIFDYLMPGFLYSYSRFRREMELPIVNGQEENLHRLQRMIRPFVLRRMKKDVLKDLPDKAEELIYTRLEGEQRELYDAHAQKLRMLLEGHTDEELAGSKIQILSELTKLRQLCCSPELLYENYQGESAKLELCMQYVMNAVNGGHKVLLFSQFTSVLDILCRRLEKEDMPYYLLTGQTGKHHRLEMVEAFQKDEVPVFLISLKAGGTGLNLTAADIVVHFDPWWNLAAQNQATDRAHRIGQKNKVTVYKLIASDTIEDRIVELQEKKQELASQLLSGDSADTFRFSREELLELLR